MAAAEMKLPIVESDYADRVIDVGTITLGEEARKNRKDHQLNAHERVNLLRGLSASLKGKVALLTGKMKNEGYAYEHGIGQDLEQAFGKIVSDVHNHLDFMVRGSTFWFFVKSSLCDGEYGTLNTHLYRRNITCTDQMNESAALKFLKELKRTGGRSYSPPILPEDRACTDESHNEAVAAKFFNSKRLIQKELFHVTESTIQNGQFHITESTHVEIKTFRTEKWLQRIKEMLPKYVSAFANTDGGYLLFVLKEDTKEETGFKADKCDLLTSEMYIKQTIRKLPVYHFCKEKKEIDYTCKFLEVHDENRLCGFVCAIRIEKFCCAVFAEDPDSWHVTDNFVVQMTSMEWVEFMMQVLSRKVIYTPKSIYKKLFLQHQGLQQLIHNKIESFRDIILFSESLSSDLGLEKEEDVICDALLIPMRSPPVLCTIFMEKDKTGDDSTRSVRANQLKLYCKRTAQTLKEKLLVTL
ncbi:schlafen family member 12-like [Octodon degus]|uniref:Schlafen family member 12-like n=1 Tax=Octodon degus TaxID=10160 RepID=A0A6P3FAE4_OCTDE|nr:schlafen family member 12-like [Octodon degus]